MNESDFAKMALLGPVCSGSGYSMGNEVDRPCYEENTIQNNHVEVLTL